MGFEAKRVVLDACVLYPFHQRNLLVQCAVDRLIDVRWTDRIHEEWIKALLEKDPSISREKLLRVRDLMNRSLPGATVQGFEHYIHSIDSPDPSDRHVVAAAVASEAIAIISWNIRDFPAALLAPHGLVCETPDDLLTALFVETPNVITAVVRHARLNLRRSAPSPEDYLEALRAQRLVGFVGRIAPRLADL